MSKDGVTKCEEALDRLLNSCPRNSKFSSIKSYEITPAMVSVEAGFDKGYLKRSRPIHSDIFKLIDDLTGKNKPKPNRLKENKDKKYQEQALIMQKIMTQNLKLVARVRELEKKLGIN